MKTSFLKKVLSLILSCFMLFSCSGSQLNRISELPDGSSLVLTDVQLLGLPTDASVTTDVPPLNLGSYHNGELIVPLTQDASAPFNGVLFNGPAVARITVEFNAQQQRCQIERQHDVELLTARYNTDIASMNLALQTNQRTDQVLLDAQRSDNARLQRLLQDQLRNSSGPHFQEGLIWAGGGMLVGVLIVGGIVIFANSHP